MHWNYIFSRLSGVYGKHSSSEADMDTGNMPLGEVFARVYKAGKWGRSLQHRYFSGPGSHAPEIVDPYVSAVRSFLSDYPRKMDAVDLGCGDFNVGRRLRDAFANYIACDVVRDLIQHNARTYQNLNVDFRCLDIIVDPLPRADVAILRQVLQHLGTEQIARLAPKLLNFKFVILTEHLPDDSSFTPNLEHPSGSSIRLNSGSGVVLTAPPFSLVPKLERELCSVRQRGGVVRTCVYEFNEPNAAEGPQ